MAKSSASEGFAFCVKGVLMLLLFASSLFKVSEGWCNDCEDDQVCCNFVCIYESSCLGLSCTTGMDCSFGESCCNNVCVNGSNCLGQTCSYSAECGVGETCCNGKCTPGYDCIGQPCWTDADCGSTSNEYYCCGGTCGYNDCNADNTLWVVLGLICGSVLIVIVISIFVRCICHRGLRPAYGSVIVGQRVVPATSAPYLSQSVSTVLPTRLPMLSPTAVWTVSCLQRGNNKIKWTTSPLQDCTRGNIRRSVCYSKQLWCCIKFISVSRETNLTFFSFLCYKAPFAQESLELHTCNFMFVLCLVLMMGPTQQWNHMMKLL